MLYDTTASATSHIIFTADPAFLDTALTELRRADRSLRLSKSLGEGVGLAETACSWDEFSAAVRERPPIFCRHICPSAVEKTITATPVDIDEIASGCAPVLDDVDLTLTVSVQTRLLGDSHPYGPFDINQRLAGLLQDRGASIDVRSPVQILSLVVTHDTAYMGLSMASQNLSNWAGGARRFRREAEQVSRAEFKLLEALEVFEITLRPGGQALDLGAAPGGWTRVLRMHDMQVVAVDPARLASSIEADPGVTHRRQTAQEYLPTQERFDIVVNDMRMDARDSARVMLTTADVLKPNGVAIMTLKLPERGAADVAAAAIKILGRRFRLIGARQLFHNRSEVTVVLAPAK